MSEYYPPGAFYFSVKIVSSGGPVPPQTDSDAAFESVSGIKDEFGIEELAEGGENRYVHRLPKATKHPNLVLKRGFIAADSYLAKWTDDTVGTNFSTPIVTQTVQVALLDRGGAPLASWSFSNAYPVKWEIAALNSMENKYLIETFELAYSFFERVTG